MKKLVHEKHFTFKDISLKAIALGMFLAIFLNALFAAASAALLPKPAIQNHHIIPATPVVVLLLVDGLLGSAIGGFLTARLAKQSPITNAVALGIVELVASLLLLLVLPTEDVPLWYNLIGAVLIIPSTYLGGKIATI